MKIISTCLFTLLFLIGLESQSQVVTTFNYTGAMQTFVVPPGVTSVDVEVIGAEGGDAVGFAVGWVNGPVNVDGGNGGRVTATIPVTPGETLNIYVGGEGSLTSGGFNGGGNPASGCGGTEVISSGGGGGSDIRQGGNTLADRVIVAGGGGGVAGSADYYMTTNGAGAGGGTTGQNSYNVGYTCLDGQGGTQFSGGTGGNQGCWCGPGIAGSGSFGVGGSSVCTPSGLSTCSCSGTGCVSGGGGGGGYYGGGAGLTIAGGGGGSSYAYPSATNVIHDQGINTGNGQVIITVQCTSLTTAVSATSVCAGDLVTLSANSETGGNVTWNMGVVDGIAFAPPVGTTTYTATSDNGSDCIFDVDILVTAYPVVTAIADDLTPCSGTEVTFNGGGATTYIWDNGIIDNVPSEVSGLGTTTYTVTGTTNGCSDDATIDVTLIAQPVVNAMASANPICLGDMLTLTSSGDALSYSWGTLIDEGVAFQPTFTGTYNVTGVNSFGCYTTTGITVVVNSLPIVDAGADQVACQGESVVLSGNNALTYVWNNGVTNAVPFTAAVVGANTYQVTGTDANGCDDIDQVTITVMEAPVITAVVVNEENGFDGSIDLTVTGGTGNYDYSWAHGYTVADISGLTSTMTYTVTVSDGICESDSTFTILNVLGLNGENGMAFQVYPNPTTENVTVTFDGSFNFYVTDMLGKVISSGNGNGQETISMATFADGSYLLTVLSGDITRTIQVLKQ